MVTLTLTPESFELLRQIFSAQSQLQLPVGVAGQVVQIQQAIADVLRAAAPAHTNGMPGA